MRPIDADALLQEFERRQEQQISNYCDCFLNDARELSTEWNCVEDIVENAPTIEAEPVSHGRWEDGAFENSKRCSVCKNYASKVYCHSEPIFDYKRCPNCGAKMDLEVEYK